MPLGRRLLEGIVYQGIFAMVYEYDDAPCSFRMASTATLDSSEQYSSFGEDI